MAAKRALVVDDSKSARVVLSRMLEKYGIAVNTAESAEAALDYLRQDHPDVVFMDHLMPGMDGLQAVRVLKADPATASIPIVMYTSQEGELYVGQAKAVGAVGVLPKTVKPIDVTKVLYQLRLLPDTHSRLVYIFTVLVEGVRRQKEIFEAFMVYRMKQVTSFRPFAEQDQTGMSLLINEIIALGQQSGELRSDLEEGMLAGLFEYALIAAIKPLYLQPDRYDQFKSVHHSVDLFLNGARR